ncbi:MAG: DUF6335 family protein [Vicinamibacterales bacterium]
MAKKATRNAPARSTKAQKTKRTGSGRSRAAVKARGQTKAASPVSKAPKKRRTISGRTSTAAKSKRPRAASTRPARGGKTASKAKPNAQRSTKAARKTGSGTKPKSNANRPAARGPQRAPRSERSVPTPPSSLDLKRRGTAARTGRAEMAEERQHLGAMRALTGGDVDADAENAYFSGDEAPGGDNPTPDQDIVDDIGRALGVEYQDAEELRGSDKVAERDKHRWELDPASSEDYRDRR